MGGSNTSDSDGISLNAAVNSILGVKGPLRFRPHGSSQKAHVILRRVTYSDDSSDDGEASRVVRFSLFAHKRIEVKPGKEILLAIDTEDGLFKDTPIVFEGDLSLADGSSDEESTTQVAEPGEDEEYLPPMKYAMPPKMRRAWTKRIEEVNSISPESVPRNSIGVQATAEYTSTAIQALPSGLSISTQTDPIISSPLPLPSQKSLTTHQVSSQPQVSVEPKQGHITSLSNESVSVVDDDAVVSDDDMDIASPQRDRSLSPMELDSPSTSPPSSPIKSACSPLPKETPLQEPSVTSTSRIEETSNDSKPSPSTVVNRTIPEIDKVNTYPISSPAPLETQVHSPIVASTKQASKPLSKSPTSASASKPECKTVGSGGKKPGIYDMFVPATLSTGPTHILNINLIPETVSSPLSARVEPPALPSKPVVSPLHSPILQGTSSQAPTTAKITSLTQNAIASSSKIVLDRPPVPTEPRSLAAFSSRSHGKAPATGPTHLERVKALRSGKASSPPPDPKALAYIPSGPSTNPLGIRPSAMSAVIRTTVLDRPPPTAPKSLAGAAKKPVVVGSSWSAARGSSTSASSATTSATPNSSLSLVSSSSPTPVQPITQKISKPTDLSNMLEYSSPSPPPPPPPPPESDPPPPVPPPPASKWIPLATPKHKVTNGSQESLQSDLSQSQPPSPVNQSSLPSPLDNRSRLEALSTVPSSAKKPSKPAALSNGQQKTPNNRATTQGGAVNGDGKVDETPSNEKAGNSVPLKDRISSTKDTLSHALAQTPTPACNANRALLSRIFDIPSNSPPGSPTHNAKTGTTSGNSSNPKGLSPVPLIPGVPAPLNHPLPPKPVQAAHIGSSYRGVKRDRPLTPEPQDRRRNKRTFDWPTVESNFTVSLQGEGDRTVRSIAFSSDGAYFVLSCADRTIRVWNNRVRAEIARLSHNSAIISTMWLDGDTGVIVLTEDGLVSKWTRGGENQWTWAKILDAGNEFRSDQDSICFAYLRDRVAVSFPRMGVKVWIWSKGTWQAQRSILRQNVTAIKFIEDGAALIGGTRDGALWYCEIPNGTLRAYAFLKTKIISLDVSPTGTHVLVNQVGSSAFFVSLRKSENKGVVEHNYTFKDTDQTFDNDFGATFATKGQAVLFGCVEGCVLVWDRRKCAIVYGLEHDEDDSIGAVATFDGAAGKDGCMLTGTKHGQLCWWALPVAAPQNQVSSGDSKKKRQKVVS